MLNYIFAIKLYFPVLFFLLTVGSAAQDGAVISAKIFPIAKNYSGTNPQEVLVVVNRAIEESFGFGKKYCEIHNIPLNNMVLLDIPASDIYDGKLVEIRRNNEVIYDTAPWEISNRTWRYFKKYIFEPINNHLNSNQINGIPLYDKIKYFVIFKGVPYKIAPHYEYSYNNDGNRTAVSVDALLAISFQDELAGFDILNLFGSNSSEQENPYYNIEINYSGDQKFKSRYYRNTSGIKLSYLVSRIDALNNESVTSLIERNSHHDVSGNNIFVLDYHDSTSYLGKLHAANDSYKAAYRLNQLGYDFLYEKTNQKLYKFDKKVVGYMSSGKHAGMPIKTPYMMRDSGTVFASGSVVATVESFSAFFADTIGSNLSRQDNMAVVSEYMDAGFSGGTGNSYEPYTSSIVSDSIFFPAYASGYNLVDAAYMAMPYLGFRNVVYGDPFMCISLGKQTIHNEMVLSDTSLFMGEVTVAPGTVFKLLDNSHLKFRHHGYLQNNGILSVGENVSISGINRMRSLILDNSGINPKLLWASTPDLRDRDGFRIYRKSGSDDWKMIDSTSSTNFTDSSINIESSLKAGILIAYRITGFDGINESLPTNEITIHNGIGETIAPQKDGYGISNPFPNPFNSVVKIKYIVPRGATPDSYKISVFDILGNEIVVLPKDIAASSIHEVSFDADGLASGVYFIVLASERSVTAKKVLLLR